MIQRTYIKINDIDIPTVIRSYKTARHLKMYFKANILYVSKPQYVSAKKAMEFVKKNNEEVYKMFKKLNSDENTKIKHWNTGEIFLFKGEEYTVETKKIASSEINLRIDNSEKKLFVSYPEGLPEEDKKYNIDRGIKKVLKNNTEILLESKVPYWSKITNISYKQFKVNDATSKYGSCIPSTKVLHFSSRLIMLPEDKIDAVIVHELCHIVYPNHSKNFYDLVRNYIPDYDEINKWLKKNGKLILF